MGVALGQHAEHAEANDQLIPALLPRGPGHRFVCYADSCSGVPGAPHEASFAAVNAVVRRISPAPEFICFPGDAVIGLTTDDAALRTQWRHWFDREMGWLDRRETPLYLTPGNHDVYDSGSEDVWREVMRELPCNGPPGQERTSYLVRRGNLAMVFVDTVSLALGGEGRVDVAWVDHALRQVEDARHKVVVGHHPVWPVNGYIGPYQRCVADDDGQELWNVLVRHDVEAYLCSHMLAFDVQVHDGVPQIMTAGAGTIHRMPPESEYLHCVQLALDARGVRYQVLDDRGWLREWLSWPPALPSLADWQPFDPVRAGEADMGGDGCLTAWRLIGVAASDGQAAPQTLLSGWQTGAGLAPLWIGLEGKEQRLVVLMSQQAGRSPHRWLGPALVPGQPFDVQILLHTGMGPGGVLWRTGATAPWSTLRGVSTWGPERLPRLEQWAIGHGQRSSLDRPFRGADLRVTTCQRAHSFEDLF